MLVLVLVLVLVTGSSPVAMVTFSYSFPVSCSHTAGSGSVPRIPRTSAGCSSARGSAGALALAGCKDWRRHWRWHCCFCCLCFRRPAETAQNLNQNHCHSFRRPHCQCCPCKLRFFCYPSMAVPVLELKEPGCASTIGTGTGTG